MPLDKLIMPAAARYPRVRFVHLNYAGGPPATVRRAVRFSWACARLFGHDGYLAAPGAYALERDDIYNSDLGKPAGDRWQVEPGGKVVWRAYEKGIAAINCGPGAGRIVSLGLHVPPGPDGYVLPSRRS